MVNLSCPQCGLNINIDDLLWKHSKSVDSIHYFKCKACKEMIGFTTLMMPINNKYYSIWRKNDEK